MTTATLGLASAAATLGFAWAAATCCLGSSTCVTFQHFEPAGAGSGHPRFGHALDVHFAR